MADIQIRPARAEDRAAVLSFCQDTWEWGDYIEYIWDDWLAATDGRLFVAMVHGHPAGIVNVRMLTDTEAWLEGLRVDPQYRRQGLARALNLAALAEAMQRGAKYARLTVESDNKRSIHLAEMGHMRQVGAFALYTAEPLTDSEQRENVQERTQIASEEDLDDIIDYLNNSNVFPAAGGLYYVSFTAREITETFLRAKIAARQVYLLRRWERIDGLAIAERRFEHEQQRLSVGYIDGTAIEPISLIAYDLRRLLPELELDAVCIYAPDLVLIRDVLGGLGYEWNGIVFYTFERGLE